MAVSMGGAPKNRLPMSRKSDLGSLYRYSVESVNGLANENYAARVCIGGPRRDFGGFPSDQNLLYSARIKSRGQTDP